MIIKVCGITVQNQFEQLNELGIEMIGFNFYEPSKRYLEEPLKTFHDKSQRVGVFVNPNEDEVKEHAEKHSLEFIQLHGNESVDFTKKLAAKNRIIKVFGIDNTFDFSITKDYESFAEYFLFDTKTSLFGGSGIKFDWQKLTQYQGSTPFLLSGGIQPGDAHKLRQLQHEKFIGVDINSGFENSPGNKNIELIRSFKAEFKHEESR